MKDKTLDKVINNKFFSCLIHFIMKRREITEYMNELLQNIRIDSESEKSKNDSSVFF